MKKFTRSEAERLAKKARRILRRQFKEQFKKHLPMLIIALDRGWTLQCLVSVQADKEEIDAFHKQFTALQVEEAKTYMTPDERIQVAAQQGAADLQKEEVAVG